MELKVTKRIPFFLGKKIQSLNSLEKLDLSNCMEIYSLFLLIKEFPVSLTYIDLSFTSLTDKPYLDFKHLINLHTLLLSNTNIVYFPACPPSLCTLDVSSNDLINPCLVLTPSEIQVISNLKTLIIYGNRDINLPSSIPLCILQF